MDRDIEKNLASSYETEMNKEVRYAFVSIESI